MLVLECHTQLTKAVLLYICHNIRDFGLGWGIRKGLIHEYKTTAKITTYIQYSEDFNSLFILLHLPDYLRMA